MKSQIVMNEFETLNELLIICVNTPKMKMREEKYQTKNDAIFT